MKGTHLGGLEACHRQTGDSFHLPYCPIQPKHPWEIKLSQSRFFSSTKYTFPPLFLDNIIFSLDILHGREAGRLHGPQMDLSELRQHAVEPAIEGLEGSLGPGWQRSLGGSNIHNLCVRVSILSWQATAAGLDASDASHRPSLRHIGARVRIRVTGDKFGHQEAAPHWGLRRTKILALFQIRLRSMSMLIQSYL